MRFFPSFCTPFAFFNIVHSNIILFETMRALIHIWEHVPHPISIVVIKCLCGNIKFLKLCRKRMQDVRFTNNTFTRFDHVPIHSNKRMIFSNIHTSSESIDAIHLLGSPVANYPGNWRPFTFCPNLCWKYCLFLLTSFLSKFFVWLPFITQGFNCPDVNYSIGKTNEQRGVTTHTITIHRMGIVLFFHELLSLHDHVSSCCGCASCQRFEEQWTHFAPKLPIERICCHFVGKLQTIQHGFLEVVVKITRT